MVTVGIDEVGRGCWAGPLVAAAVAMEQSIPGLRDSKKLSAKQRQKLDAEIRSQVKSIGVGWVTPGEIDTLGMTKSVQLAMLRAVKQIIGPYDEVIIDGNIQYFKNVVGLKTNNVVAVVGADGTVPAVSAASIVAKVARDQYMAEQAALFPGYAFEKNVGYGTAAHIAGLQKVGICPLHRTSFKPIKPFIISS